MFRRILARTRAWLPHWTSAWAADSGFLLVSQFTAVIASSALAVMLARTLGPSTWGLLSGFLALSLALSIFVNFGVGTWLLRELTRLWASSEWTQEESRARAGYLVTGGLSLNAGLGLIVLLGTLVVAMVMRLDAGLTFVLICLMGNSVLLAASSVLEAFFRARRRVRRVAAALLLEKTLLLILIAVAVVSGLGITGIALMYVVAGMARFVFVWSSLVARDDFILEIAGLTNLRQTLAGSIPFGLNAASTNLIPRLDAFLIATISTTAAGFFAVGDRVVGPALIVPAVMSSALYPFLASESDRSATGWRIVFLLAGAGAALAAIGVVLAPFLVPLLFGSDYRPAVNVVQLMLLVIPFVYGSGPLAAHLYASGRERSVLAATVTVSCLGTSAVVGGQLALGAVGAAGGYVLRNALFFFGLVGVALAHRALPRHEEGRKRDPMSSVSTGGTAMAPHPTEHPERSIPDHVT